MASVADICNLALSHLGDEAQVATITPPDGSIQSAHCARFYPIVRSLLLEMHPWTFATKRVALAEVDNPAPEDWSYAYSLPSTCIRPLSALSPGTPERFFGSTDTDAGSHPYLVEAAQDDSQILLTNVDAVYLRYIDLINDTTKYTPGFVACFARLLASYLAGPILKGDTGMKVAGQQLQIFAREYASATAHNANTGRRDIRQTYQPAWLAARGHCAPSRSEASYRTPVSVSSAPSPAPAPAPAPAPTPAPTPAPSPAPSPSPAPAPSAPTITVADEVTDVLQVGDHMVHTNEWGKGALTRGAYTGVGGTTYEQQIGVAYPPGGSQDPIALRIKWAWPSGPNEVKSYPSIVTGNFPGWRQTGTPNIAGTWPLRKQDGSYSTTLPSGKTPNTIFPIAIPVTGVLQAHGSWAHNTPPTGRGHLSYDIWVQDSGPQGTGFTVPPIHTEIMIPLTYWGGYGEYAAAGGGRNPDWYWGDDTIDGYLWHIFQTATSTKKNGDAKSNSFNGAWHFWVFEPDSPTALPADYQPNLALFLNYGKTKGWLDVPNPVSGNVGTHVVSVELGVEPHYGTGDIEIYDYKITNT